MKMGWTTMPIEETITTFVILYTPVFIFVWTIFLTILMKKFFRIVDLMEKGLEGKKKPGPKTKKPTTKTGRSYTFRW